MLRSVFASDLVITAPRVGQQWERGTGVAWSSASFVREFARLRCHDGAACTAATSSADSADKGDSRRPETSPWNLPIFLRGGERA